MIQGVSVTPQIQGQV